MFEKYYKQHLAKRLLHGRSSSEDAGADRTADVLLSYCSPYCSSRIIVFCRCHAASLVHVKPLPLRRGCTAQALAGLHCKWQRSDRQRVFTLLTLHAVPLALAPVVAPFVDCRAAAADQAEDGVRLPVHIQAGNDVWRHQAQQVWAGHAAVMLFFTTKCCCLRLKFALCQTTLW